MPNSAPSSKGRSSRFPTQNFRNARLIRRRSYGGFRTSICSREKFISVISCSCTIPWDARLRGTQSRVFDFSDLWATWLCSKRSVLHGIWFKNADRGSGHLSATVLLRVAHFSDTISFSMCLTYPRMLCVSCEMYFILGGWVSHKLLYRHMFFIGAIANIAIAVLTRRAFLNGLTETKSWGKSFVSFPPRSIPTLSRLCLYWRIIVDDTIECQICW